MPRLIDADAVFRWYVETFSEKNIGERAIQPNEIRFSMNDIRDNLYNMPTIEAEPVIRCKDCVHYKGHWYCETWNNSPGFPAVKEDGFCNMAERRTDG